MNQVYVNIDIDSANCPFLNKVLDQKGTLSEEMLYPFVDIYKRTQTTDILFNIFCQVSIPPSSQFESVPDLCEYLEKDSDTNSMFYGLHKSYLLLYKKYNMDPFAIWIKRCKQNGINPWISIRMNDCHPFSVLLEDGFHSFLKTAVDNDWILGADYGYYQYCYNYRIEEVRNKMLAYIKEQISRYDIYGIELDFMREIQCFRYLTDNMSENTEIMNDFMRDIKKLVTEAEKMHGHKIKICVRVMRDIVQTKYYGFDPEVWVKEKIVDVINPTPRWTGGDSGIPIKEWKALLPGVEIAPGIETVVNYSKERGLGFASSEIARGLCASFLSQGADGVYFFNYFMNPEEDAQYCSEHLRSAHSLKRNFSVLSGCADFETIYKSPVRFVIIPQADEAFAKTPSLWQPLPALLKCEDKKTFEIVTGTIPTDKHVYLVLGIKGDINDAQVMINGIEYNAWSTIELSFLPGIGSQPANYISEGVSCKKLEMDQKEMRDTVQEICIKTHALQLEITWLELVVY